MLVYGDPQYQISSEVFLGNFSERLRRLRPNNLDDLRALLIQAGQFEQGCADAGHDERKRTDAFASAFYSCWKREPVECLEDQPPGPDATLTVKIPEGYEFYALYPEQYMASAEALARERSAQRALVIGIRSIGTSLSAAVGAALQANGWKTERHTVRPEGHPFDRKVTLPRINPGNFDLAIIVDEGPGLSGSSVAAVWDALRSAGFSKITIFPGHENGPGSAASEATRALWAQAEKRFTPAEKSPYRDISAGKWRQGNEPAFIPFERAKYLAPATGDEAGSPALSGQPPSNDARTKPAKAGTTHPEEVLWKFAGLGAAYENGKTALELAWQRMQTLAAEGFGPTPIETARGFIAMPWIEGKRMTKEDARDPAVRDFLSQYVVRFAGLPLSPEETRAGQERLAQMAVANAREALGDKWAQVARHKLDRGRDVEMFQSYGDGRMAPHEWIRNADGRIFKVDSFGHDADHTLIGKQSVIWDLAGLILEWELPDAQTEEFVQSLKLQGVCLTPEVLDFYELSYAAFRMGLANFCGLGAVEKAFCHKLLHILNRN